MEARLRRRQFRQEVEDGGSELSEEDDSEAVESDAEGSIQSWQSQLVNLHAEPKRDGRSGDRLDLECRD